MTTVRKDKTQHCTHPVAQRLLSIMQEKQSNLCLSADVTKSSDLLKLAETIGPEICVLKTHIDIVDDFTPYLTKRLRDIADEKNFLIFEDRKFADIGNTVKHQYQDGIYHIVEWADIVNAHTIPGEGIIEGLKAVGLPKSRALLMLAEMSSKGHLFDKAYQQATLEMSEKHRDFVIGFVTQHALNNDPSWLNFTPGVKLEAGTDKLGQQYNTPETAAKNGTDVIIVGRGIIQADDPVTEAKKYREHAVKYYFK